MSKSVQSDCEYIRSFKDAENVCICKYPLGECKGLPCKEYQQVPIKKIPIVTEEKVKCIECEETK